MTKTEFRALRREYRIKVLNAWIAYDELQSDAFYPTEAALAAYADYWRILYAWVELLNRPARICFDVLAMDEFVTSDGRGAVRL